MAKVKDPKMIAQGKRNRAAGGRFERKVRGDLEDKGWTVDRWSNQLALENNKIHPARAHFGMSTTGFPDFVAFRNVSCYVCYARMKIEDKINYEVIGIEVKSNGWLDKQEKEKCRIYLDKEIFNKILIARKGKKRGEIVYEDFTTKLFKEVKMENGLKNEVATDETVPEVEAAKETTEEVEEETTEEVDNEEPVEKEVAEEESN